MSHTDSTDDTDLSPLGSEAKHEMQKKLRTLTAGGFYEHEFFELHE